MKSRVAACVLMLLMACAAQATVYNPVTQFYVQAPSGQVGGATATQSGANGWYYQYSASHAGFSLTPGYNVGANALLTRTYNDAPYQVVAGPNDFYDLWAYSDGYSTAEAPMIFDDGLGHLGLMIAGSLPGSNWANTILTWQAPTAGIVDVNYAVTNAGTNTTYAELDLWNGATLTSLFPQTQLIGGASASFVATGILVNPGDQIQFWRDGFVDQQTRLLLSGSLTLVVPEPASLLMLCAGAALVLRRRRQ